MNSLYSLSLFGVLALIQVASSQTVQCASPWAFQNFFNDTGQRLTFSVDAGNPSSPALVSPEGDLVLNADVNVYIRPQCHNRTLSLVAGLASFTQTDPTPDLSFTLATSWLATASFSDFQAAADNGNGLLLVQRNSLPPDSNSPILDCCNLTSVAATAGSSAGTEAAASSSSASSALSSSSSSSASVDDPDADSPSPGNSPLSSQPFSSSDITNNDQQSIESSSSSSASVSGTAGFLFADSILEGTGVPNIAIFGAAAGLLLLLVIACTALCCIMKKRRRNNAHAASGSDVLMVSGVDDPKAGTYATITPYDNMDVNWNPSVRTDEGGQGDGAPPPPPVDSDSPDAAPSQYAKLPTKDNSGADYNLPAAAGPAAPGANAPAPPRPDAPLVSSQSPDDAPENYAQIPEDFGPGQQALPDLAGPAAPSQSAPAPPLPDQEV